MRIRKRVLGIVTGFILSAVVSATGVFAQETPLSLGDVMTALQSTSSGLTLSQKNTFIIQRVEQRGVTFSLSNEISNELKRAGASSSLITAISDNGPQSNQTSTSTSANKTPRIEFDRLWVEQNVERSGRAGMLIHTKYTAYNLKDTPLQLTIRFQGADKKNLKTTNESYANKSGDLALFRNFNPGHDAAVYNDWSVFIPYEEFTLSPGTHELKIDADVINPKGDLIKHMALHSVTLVKPVPSLRKPRAVFDKMWVDYGVTEGGLLGMRVHVKLRTYNLKDATCYLKIGFEKDSGEQLVAGNTLFSDRSGRVTLFSELKPVSATANYNDISVFMPYKELNLPKGSYELKMHGDLIYPDGGLISHLNNYRFRYNKK